MENIVIYLGRAPEYCLDGDLVHVTSFSGDQSFHKVLTINQFMAAHAASKRVIDEWAAHQRQPNVIEFRPTEAARA